jgi:PTS system nitrogen regulatory IIA component
MTLHFGATLRLLRIESGLSLRDLARRLDVSSTYISRVENGIDAVPTPERLEAIARELGIPKAILLDLAHRVSPLVAEYIERVPEAGRLFLEIAHRKLDSKQLGRLGQILDAEFPRASAGAAEVPGLVDLLSPDRIVLQLTCAAMEDALDVVAGRLAGSGSGASASTLASALRQHEAEVSSAIGNGVAVPCAYFAGAAPAAALVTLARPLRHDTPDRLPLRVLVVLSGPRRASDRMPRLAHVARLAARGLSERLASVRSPAEVMQRLAAMEALR